MPVPERVRVKLSSESAGYVSMTPVVVQEFSFIELIEQVLSATGRDAGRVRELLKRGTLVAGASRFRWEPIEAAVSDIEPILDAMPGPEPERPFAAGRCARIVLCGPSTRLELLRETALARRWLRSSSFWEAILAESVHPEYVTYHYRDRSDQYRLALSFEAIERLKQATSLLKFEATRRQVVAAAFQAIEYYVPR
jgi:hypothetical protein